MFRAVDPPGRLVFTFAWDGEAGERGAETLVTITFSEQGGGTLMLLRQAPFPSVERRDGHRDGWTSSFERLDELLAAA